MGCIGIKRRFDLTAILILLLLLSIPLAQAKFMQADSKIPDPYNPQSFNRYAYTLNNPYTFFDPTGKEPVRSQALQSGSAGSVYNYIRSIESTNPTLGPSGVLGRVAVDYNLRYENTGLSDKASNQFSSKFVYTSDKGVVDQLHFFTNAYATQVVPENTLIMAEYAIEVGQCLFTPSSCFSYEDLKSNRIGREFGRQVNSEDPLSEQYAQFMQANGVTDFPDWLWSTMPKTETPSQPLPQWKQDFSGSGSALPSGFVNPRTGRFVPLNPGESYENGDIVRRSRGSCRATGNAKC